MTSLFRYFDAVLIVLGLVLIPSGKSFAGDEDDNGVLLNSVELSCVASGFQSATGNAISEKWLAFLAMGVQTQRNYNPKATPRTNSDDKLFLDKDPARAEQYHRYLMQRRVIELIQTYGACFENKLDSSGNLSSKRTMSPLSSSKLIKIEGFWKDRPVANERNFVSGFISGRFMKDKEISPPSDKGINLYRNVFGLNSSFDPATVFGYDDIEWGKSSLEDRRTQNFEKFLNCALSGNTDPNCKTLINLEQPAGAELKNCLQDIRELQQKSSLFKNDLANRENSAKLCESMVNECELDSASFCRPWNRQKVSAGNGNGNTGSGNGKSLFNAAPPVPTGKPSSGTNAGGASK